MANNSDIINAFHNLIGEQEAAAALGRLLRVPSLWHQLHNDAFLQEVLPLFMEGIQPGKAAAAILGAPSLRQAANTVHINAERGPDGEPLLPSPASPSFEDVAIVAARMTLWDRPESAAALAQRSPGFFAEALACAWPEIDSEVLWISAVLREVPSSVASLANALLANMDRESAIPIWLTLAPAPLYPALVALEQQGEFDFVQACAAWLTEDPSAQPSAPESTLHEALLSGYLAYARGDFEAASSAFEGGWQSAKGIQAELAEHMARCAASRGDHVLAAQVWRDAFRAFPTFDRRIQLALALTRIGRVQEAADLLQTAEDHAWKNYARAKIYLASGEKSLAVRSLRGAMGKASAGSLPIAHLEDILQAARDNADIHLATQASRLITRKSPSSAAGRLAYAETLSEAGDSLAASEQAALALALQPDSMEAAAVLAKSLQACDKHVEALPLWDRVAAADSKALPELGNCALQAGQYDLAQRSAEQLLEIETQSPTGLSLLGRTLAAQGQYDQAKEHLARATQLNPDSPEPWLALAECLRAEGDEQAAGTTLFTAVQAIPQDRGLRMAYAAWLAERERWVEALDEIEQATQGSEVEPEWLVEKARVLMRLGRNQEAIPHLQAALAARPADWGARKALAIAWEVSGDLEQASTIAEDAPHSIPSRDEFIVGRILAQSSHARRLEASLRHLEDAKNAELDEPEIDFWLASAHEKLGHQASAMLYYKAYLEGSRDFRSERYLPATLGLARTALAESESDLALARLTEARQVFPTSIDLLVLLAQATLQSGDTSRALRIARQAKDLNPAAIAPLEIARQIALEMDDVAAALKSQEQLLHIAPSDPVKWIEMAELKALAGDGEEARSHLAHALMLDRSDPAVLQRAAQAAHAASEDDLACSLLQRVAAKTQDDPERQRFVAELAESLGSDQLAEQAWRMLASLEPDNDEPLVNAAHALWRLNRRSAAIGFWQEALNRAPNRADLHAGLGEALVGVGQIEQGLEHLAKAADLEPQNGDVQLRTGLSLLRNGEAAEALQHLRLAAKSETPAAVAALGECLLALERPEEALIAFERASGFPDAPAKVFALQTIAYLRMKDLSMAETCYRMAASAPAVDLFDRVWRSRAALSLGRWQDTLAPLQSWLQEKPQDWLAAAHLSATALALANHNYLYGEEARAVSHAPQACFEDGGLIHAVASAFETLQEADPPVSIRAAFEAWRQIVEEGTQAEGRIKPEDLPADFRAWARNSLSAAQLHANRPARALSALGDDIAGAEGISIILASLAHHRAGDPIQACAGLRRIETLPVIGPISLFLRGVIQQEAGDQSEAISAMNAALAIWGNEPEWHATLADLYLEQDRYDLALPHLQQAAELAPHEIRYLIPLAKNLRRIGDLVEAEAVFARALQQQPASAEIWKEAGQVALQTGNAEQAEAWFERACTLAPSDAACLIGSAQAALHRGALKAASKRAQAAFRLAPNDPVVLTGLGEIMAHEGKHEEALSAYARALKSTQAPLAVRLARADVLLRTGKVEAAIDELHIVTDIASDDPSAWQSLAHAYEIRKDYDQALEAAARSVSLAPKDRAARLLLGRLCRLSGQLDRALDELSQASDPQRPDPEVLLEMGRVHEERRELDRALDAYQQGLAAQPESTQLLLRAGHVLKSMKAYPEAGSMFEQVVRLNPRDPKAYHQLAAVRALQLVHGGMAQQVVTP